MSKLPKQQLKLRKPLKWFPSKNRNSPSPNGNFFFWLTIGFIFLLMMSQSPTMNKMTSSNELSYSDFYSTLKDNEKTGRISKLELVEGP